MLLEFKLQIYDGDKCVIHWRCEFLHNSSVMWVPVPYDDLIVAFDSIWSKTGKTNLVGPNSHTKFFTYKSGTVLYGTRLPLNTHMGLHENNAACDYELVSINTQNLDDYQRQVSEFLAQHVKSLDLSTEITDHTYRRRVKRISDLSPTKLKNLVRMHDFLASECGYGVKDNTIAGNIDPEFYYDQPHFNQKFSQIFDCSPTNFFSKFNGLAEQLLSISYKHVSPARVTLWLT